MAVLGLYYSDIDGSKQQFPFLQSNIDKNLIYPFRNQTYLQLLVRDMPTIIFFGKNFMQLPLFILQLAHNIHAWNFLQENLLKKI